jgi:hypothetical protein
LTSYLFIDILYILVNSVGHYIFAKKITGRVRVRIAATVIKQQQVPVVSNSSFIIGFRRNEERSLDCNWFE